MQSQTRTPGRNTPGRRRNANKENVYFEPGKYGRKTGITLKDTGRRDEYGFEPVSGIFSSPHHETPERLPLGRTTRNSTINEARTPRLPPPRSQTPRRTNIGGSPVRHSAIRSGSPTRVADDDVTPSRAPSAFPDDEMGDVVHSIERISEPIEARRSAKALGKRTRKSIFEFNLSPEKAAKPPASSPSPEMIAEVSRILDTSDAQFPEQTLEDSGTAEGHNDPDDSLPDVSEMIGGRTSLKSQSNHAHVDEPNIKRKRGARRSDVSQQAADDRQDPEAHSSPKRPRTAEDITPVEPSPSQRLAPRHSGVSLPSRGQSPEYETYGDDDPVLELSPEVGEPPEPITIEDDDDEDANEPESRDSSRSASLAEQVSPSPSEAEEEEEASQSPRHRAPKRKSMGLKRRKQSSAAAPQPRARVADSAYDSSATPANDDDAGLIHGGMRYRSATPFEEPDVKITRSGRFSVKPLKFWNGEKFVVEKGEVQGIVRAEELLPGRRRPQPQRKKQQQRKARLGRIGEEDDEDDGVLHEDLRAESWEDEVGVVSGRVRGWDWEVQAGSVEVQEMQDVGFASRAINTQETAGGAFRYAKVLTSPFFGAGVVELPPRGVKRTKNCRKMQMAFFVHEGKVTVDVAGMVFGVTQGGMFQVPRGNNYAIENESRVFPAKVFFAQGCEYDALAAMEAAEQSQTS